MIQFSNPTWIPGVVVVVIVEATSVVPPGPDTVISNDPVIPGSTVVITKIYRKPWLRSDENEKFGFVVVSWSNVIKFIEGLFESNVLLYKYP